MLAKKRQEHYRDGSQKRKQVIERGDDEFLGKILPKSGRSAAQARHVADDFDDNRSGAIISAGPQKCFRYPKALLRKPW